MNQEKTIRRLEFDTILEEICERLPSDDIVSLFKNLGFVHSVEELEDRHKILEEAIQLVMKYSPIPRGALHSIWEWLDYSEKEGVLQAEALLEVMDNLRTQRLLKRFYDNIETFDLYFPSLAVHFGLIEPDTLLENRLQQIFDTKGDIKDTASSELASIRRKLESTQGKLKERVNTLVTQGTISPYLQEQIITIRNDRYVVPVKSQHKTRVPGMIHSRSSSGSTLYIEPMELVDLNNALSELLLEEREEIRRILQEVSSQLGRNAWQIRVNEEQMHKIYLQVYLAQYHLDKGMHVAKTAPLIDIVKGRHPFIDKREVVPLQLNFGKKERVLVITGPNTGGKTVVLKTVGLFSLMHKYGLGIPADEGSRLPLFDGVFADIGDEQNIQQSLSTFSSHITNIGEILKECTEDSLVLLDEIGAGTDPTEGSALARAILSVLKDRGCLTLSTSHYSDVKEFALSTEGFENASVEFDLQNLRPTFRLLMGVPGNSNALRIAKRLGMEEDVISRSYDFMEESAKKLEVAIGRMEETRRENQRLLEESKMNLEEARKKHEKYEKALENLRSQRQRIIDEAKRQSAKLYKEEQAEVKEILKELREMKKGSIDHQKAEQLGSDFYEKTQVPSLEKKQSFQKATKIKKGDLVYIPKLSQEATALEDAEKNGDFMAQIGILKMKLNLKEVERISAKKEDKRYEQMAGSFTVSAAPKTLDLRGKSKDDTLVMLDKFIDAAWMGRLPWIEIIHGKGTGVLRAFVQKMLKENPRIEKYRLGDSSEGGDGVTIATIKY